MGKKQKVDVAKVVDKEIEKVDVATIIDEDLEHNEFVPMPKVTMPAVQKMSKDLLEATKLLQAREVRYIVKCYYAMQDGRKAANSQLKAAPVDEPHEMLSWFYEQAKVLEEQCRAALDRYTRNHVMGKWMRLTYGIGPVLSAGILAHFDITKAPTTGHFWAFAGYDPTKVWEKGKKRPFNADLRTLCWKVGQSFKKFHKKDACFYGHLYAERKVYEVARNNAGGNKEAAEKELEKKNYEKKKTDTYKTLISGKLSDGQLDSRASRYATKIFLAHLHDEWYRVHYGKEPPAPYPIAHLGHAHVIEPPQGKNVGNDDDGS